MDNSKESNSMDRPRPYASTELPRPSVILRRIFDPLELWAVTVTTVLVLSVAVSIFVLVTEASYSTWSVVTAVIIASASIVINKVEKKTDSTSISSLRSASKTKDLIGSSARVAVGGLVIGAVSLFILIGTHTVDWVQINAITRVAFVLFLGSGFIGSYLIARALVSYTPIRDSDILSVPVQISSAPELLTILGFLVPGSLILYAGFVYHQPAVYTIWFGFTVVDCFVICCSLYVLYFSLLSRI